MNNTISTEDLHNIVDDMFPELGHLSDFELRRHPTIVALSTKRKRRAPAKSKAAKPAAPRALTPEQIEAAEFKKTPAYVRIRSVIGRDKDLNAAIFRRGDYHEPTYSRIAALSDDDLLDFARETAAHALINSNSPDWHAVKARIVERFGFRR